MVEYLKINDKKYPVRVGYYVMKKVQEETGKGLMEAIRSSDEDITVHETILYAALEMGSYMENGNMDIPFNKEDMALVLDQCYYDYLDLFESEKFFPSEVKKKAKEYQKKQEKKEKDSQKNGKAPQGQEKLSRGKKTG